jgi:hypothetical protein
MPRQEIIDRGREIRRYFQQKHAGKVQDVEECREDMQRRFEINNSRWGCYWRAELNRQNSIHRIRTEEAEEPASELIPQPPQEDRPAENGEPFTLHIPPNLPDDAKLIVNALLSRTEQLQEQVEEQRLRANTNHEMYLAAHRRMGLLKRLSKELIDQL